MIWLIEDHLKSTTLAIRTHSGTSMLVSQNHCFNSAFLVIRLHHSSAFLQFQIQPFEWTLVGCELAVVKDGSPAGHSEIIAICDLPLHIMKHHHGASCLIQDTIAHSAGQAC